MFNENQQARFGTALMPLLLMLVQCFAQTGRSISMGETVSFEVNAVPGMAYCWQVKENSDLKSGTETAYVSYLTTKCNAEVLIKWQKAGTYYLSVTGFNQNGCSNTKVFLVFVSESHVPVAVDDFVSATWLKSISINLLSNDFDAANDIKPSSLKILTRPELGELTVGSNGVANYLPQKNHNGKDRFWYRICDLCDHCDTAMVTIDLKDPSLYLPQGISPNGDGINDRLIINGLSAYPGSSLSIFSREGILIYHSDDYQNDWSGEQNKRKSGISAVPEGTYYYVLHLGGTSRVIKRFVFVAR